MFLEPWLSETELPSVGMASRRPFPWLHLVGMVSHRPFPGLYDEAHRDREDSIPTGDGGPAGPRGFGGQPLALLPSVGMACRRPFPGLHLVGMVSHRPFPELSDKAHRDREDSIPTRDGGPAGPRGFGSGELRCVALGLARLLLDANITARISNKLPFDFIV